MSQKLKLPSGSQNTMYPANSAQEKGVNIVLDRQKLEQLKVITLETAQKNIEISIRIIRIWLEENQ